MSCFTKHHCELALIQLIRHVLLGAPGGRHISWVVRGYGLRSISSYIVQSCCWYLPFNILAMLSAVRALAALQTAVFEYCNLGSSFWLRCYIASPRCKWEDRLLTIDIVERFWRTFTYNYRTLKTRSPARARRLSRYYLGFRRRVYSALLYILQAPPLIVGWAFAMQPPALSAQCAHWDGVWCIIRSKGSYNNRNIEPSQLI